MLRKAREVPRNNPNPGPQHVAIIMDGNGRWATSRGRPRVEGHRRGAQTVRTIVTHARERKLPYLTLYSFSAQNWRRPPLEVAGLMQLLEEFCRAERNTLLDNGIRLDVMGRLDRLPHSTRTAVENLVVDSREQKDMTLILALDYGAQEEITQALARAVLAAQADEMDPTRLDPAFVTSLLDSGRFPAPDLIVRTGGERRLSNFMLWQAAYAELLFVDTLWPDFCADDFDGCLATYGTRERRFGGIVA